MPTIAEIYNAIKNDEEAKMISEEANKKAVQDMAALMAKNVEDLAAGELASSEGMEILEVRGKKFVVPSGASPKRSNTVMIACLFALENPAIDRILKAVNARGYFAAKDGSIELRNLIEEGDAKAIEKHEARKPGRNILVDTPEKPAAKEGHAGLVVVIGLDGRPHYIGTIHVWGSKSEAPGKPTHHMVKTVDGEELEFPAQYVKPIKGVVELADYSLKISQKQE